MRNYFHLLFSPSHEGLPTDLPSSQDRRPLCFDVFTSWLLLSPAAMLALRCFLWCLRQPISGFSVHLSTSLLTSVCLLCIPPSSPSCNLLYFWCQNTSERQTSWKSEMTWTQGGHAQGVGYRIYRKLELSSYDIVTWNEDGQHIYHSNLWQ